MTDMASPMHERPPERRAPYGQVHKQALRSIRAVCRNRLCTEYATDSPARHQIPNAQQHTLSNPGLFSICTPLRDGPISQSSIRAMCKIHFPQNTQIRYVWKYYSSCIFVLLLPLQIPFKETVLCAKRGPFKARLLSFELVRQALSRDIAILHSW
jgi:hypothetical protein